MQKARYISILIFLNTISREKTENLGIRVPAKAITTTESVASKKGYVLRKSGIIVINKRIETNEVKYHREQECRINNLKEHIFLCYEKTNKENLISNWLKEVVEKYNHPEKFCIET